MRGGAWRSAVLGFAVAGMALAFLGVEIGRLAVADPERSLLDMGAVGLGVLALWMAFARLNRHFRDLGRLRETLSAWRGRNAASLAADAKEDEAGDLARAAAEALRHGRHGETRPGERLAGVIAALEEPVVVLDDFGRIETLNPAASAHLSLAVGADIYDHLSRPELFRAIERAREDGQMVSALLRRAQGGEVPVRVKDLGLQSGIALVFPAKAGEAQPLLSGERLLLRPNARPVHLGDDDPLLALPLVSLWVATAATPVTGRPEEGPVVAVGTVRMVGPRVFRSLSLELFIDPGAPIPAEGSARHGVTSAMVAGARPFGAAWPVIADALRGCAVIGVGVEASLGTLARACRDAGLPEPEAPPTLDLARLAAALDPALEGLADGASLERLAAAFGVATDRRMGPFSPALVEAELAAVLLKQLDRRGIVTHGQARAFAAGQAGALPQ
ncbi:DNA polymerase-3 subunit epsilon [Azospirillum brasilense]|uniref:DNA polymerase-3 subunit epsilon n=1 Tax=Azospirillum brasilense TaxID=192 RepID=A0A560B6S0_AZOBR|nr:DNA polymerase III subunit epsilon [Azospirillum brasilense]TWA68179.1 DNA polymerase-3 subunit epsilon [Azospirillum brasilense]